MNERAIPAHGMCTLLSSRISALVGICTLLNSRVSALSLCRNRHIHHRRILSDLSVFIEQDAADTSAFGLAFDGRVDRDDLGQTSVFLISCVSWLLLLRQFIKTRAIIG